MAKREKSAPKKGPDLSEETLLWNQGSVFVFGVDEAGRGCLAGPVCAAVSCWGPLESGADLPVPVRDSKVMTEPQREACFQPIQEKALAYGVGFASAPEIDQWNILRATYLAVGRAFEQALRSLVEQKKITATELSHAQFAFLTDGGHPLLSRAEFFVQQEKFRGEFPLFSQLLTQPLLEKCIVKGDSKVFSIAAASVLAKVSRDHVMVRLDEQFPEYKFGVHKGYSTPMHVENLRRVGPCIEHRHSFSPVAEASSLFS